MNATTRDKLNRRLDAIEARRPERLPTIEIAIIEPGPNGPVDSGERWRFGASGGFEPHAPV